MARSRPTRASRAFIAFVVIAIAVMAAFQFHLMHKTDGVAAANPEQPKPVAANPPLMVAAITATPPATQPADRLTPTIWNRPGSTAVGGNPFAASTETKAPTTAPSAMLASSMQGPESAPALGAATSISPHPLIDAKAKMDGGDLIAARKTLNDALVAGAFSGVDLESAKKQIQEINETLIFSPRHFVNDPFGGVCNVKPGDKLSVLAANHDITWELLLRLNRMDDPKKLKAGQTLKIVQGPFHAVVTKSKFTMDMYLGGPATPNSMYVMTLPVGLGRDDSTPTGMWMIEPHHKIKHPTYYSPRGEGVIAADDPKNPLGPYWLGLTGTDGQAVGKASYGIHGTIEPDSIGKMASMGCIRMHNEDVEMVFEMLVEGKSTVLVRD